MGGTTPSSGRRPRPAARPASGSGWKTPPSPSTAPMSHVPELTLLPPLYLYTLVCLFFFDICRILVLFIFFGACYSFYQSFTGLLCNQSMDTGSYVRPISSLSKIRSPFIVKPENSLIAMGFLKGQPPHRLIGRRAGPRAHHHSGPGTRSVYQTRLHCRGLPGTRASRAFRWRRERQRCG
jgi:hypothetical protein